VIIEVSGVGFQNMGAALMLAAAAETVSAWPNVERVVASLKTGSRTQRASVGCASVLRLDAERRLWADRVVESGSRAIPTRALERLSLYKPERVDALLDASGYALGDQWGARPARRKAQLFKRYANEGKPVVLLPQALGPFDDVEVRDATTSALENVDLVFARDMESLAHFRELGLSGVRIESGPDFTNLTVPPAIEPADSTVVVIPNGRMDEMAGSASGLAYSAFLRDFVDAVLRRGFGVVVIAHEPMDQRYAERLLTEFGQSVAIEADTDPIRTKALVGGASLVVSSRYHGLVNALSQCVPAIGTSWSHKYEQLFADYGCDDSLWDVGDPIAVSMKLDSWLERRSLTIRRKELQEPAETIKADARAMWRKVKAAVSA